MSQSILQTIAVPICTYRDDESGTRELLKLIGTAFFIGAGGFFLTARHVIEQAYAEASEAGTDVGLVVKSNEMLDSVNLVVRLSNYEFAPKPYDIAAGWIAHSFTPRLTVGPVDVLVWDEVYALGYPESASLMKGPALWMNARGYRGHVQRPTAPDDVPFGNHPNGFELSFLIGPGASGAPVFTMPDQILIGVAVASYKSEGVEAEHLEVDEGGKTYSEKRVRVEQYGFAHDIRGLLDWAPDIFQGATLQQVASIGVSDEPVVGGKVDH